MTIHYLPRRTMLANCPSWRRFFSERRSETAHFQEKEAEGFLDFWRTPIKQEGTKPKHDPLTVHMVKAAMLHGYQIGVRDAQGARK